MKYAGWVFTGSREIDVPQPPDWEHTKKQFAADMSGSIAVTYTTRTGSSTRRSARAATTRPSSRGSSASPSATRRA